METETEVLDLLGRFYTERNVNLIKPYIHPSIVYELEKGGEEKIRQTGRWWNKFPDAILGARNFISYFKKESDTWERSIPIKDYYISPFRLEFKQFVILKTENKRLTFLAEVQMKGGKLYRIQLRSTKKSALHVAKRIYYTNKMFLAAARLDVNRVIRCIDKGARKNATNENGETAFTMIAIGLKIHYSPQSFIFEMGLKENEKIKERLDMLKQQFIALGYGWNTEAASTLFAVWSGKIAEASEEEKIEMLQRLIYKGVDINRFRFSYRDFSKTALHYAVLNHWLKVAEFLLANGAHPTLNTEMWSPMQEAESELNRLKKFDTENVIEIKKVEMIIEAMEKAID